MIEYEPNPELSKLNQNPEQIALDRGINILSDKKLLAVATAKGKVIGAVWYSDDENYSLDVAVDKAFEGQGIGRQLIDLALEHKEAEYPELELLVDAVNPAITHILTKKGYEVKNHQSDGRALVGEKFNPELLSSIVYTCTEDDSNGSEVNQVYSSINEAIERALEELTEYDDPMFVSAIKHKFTNPLRVNSMRGVNKYTLMSAMTGHPECNVPIKYEMDMDEILENIVKAGHDSIVYLDMDTNKDVVCLLPNQGTTLHAAMICSHEDAERFEKHCEHLSGRFTDIYNQEADAQRQQHTEKPEPLDCQQVKISPVAKNKRAFG